LIRPKYVSKTDRDLAPILAALPPRLIEGGYGAPALVTDIMIKKFVDHLPLYRQEQILRMRFGIELPRKTMADWVRIVADWLGPIYRTIAAELRTSGYLQIDETPIRYALAEGGGSGQGYLWVYRHPRTQSVLYEWHTSRGAECLEEALKGFQGTIQTDGYVAYVSYAQAHEGIVLAGCWAHARRKFFEAQAEGRAVAAWFLNQIGHLYGLERRLGDRRQGPAGRQAARAAEATMVLSRIGKALQLKAKAFLPQSLMGKAIAYALSRWTELGRYRDDGRLEIDNNGVENAIRPTALGKKNWLFIGHPEAGDRSAIIYTVLENCRRLGINPEAYLRDVLERLPAMKIQDVGALVPARWAKSRKAKAA
jgi:transposase